MERTTQRVQTLIMASVFIFLSFLSFYCACYRLPVGVKYFVNVAITGWALIAFMIKPRMEKMAFCAKFTLLNFVPFFLFWLWSLVIWIVDFQTTDYMIRGTQNIIYMLTNILYLCAAFYLFGKKAVYYTFYAMCMANMAVFIEVGMSDGFGLLFKQYFVLLTSFANVTGDTIRKMELHDMVFGWGPMIIYFVMARGEKFWKRMACMAVSVFFFTLGLKRIGAAAVVLAILLGFLYMKLKTVNKRRLYIIFPLVFIVLAFGYVVTVKTGVFVDFVDKLGINLLGRESIFMSYDNYYEISPTFIGNGIRFIYNHGVTEGDIGAIHNVFLELYIEVGFVMWFIWMWYDLRYRAKWMAKRYTYDSAGFLFAVCIYVFITYMTDNTFFYFPINVTYRLLVMVWCYDVGIKKHRIKGEPDELPEKGAKL